MFIKLFSHKNFESGAGLQSEFLFHKNIYREYLFSFCCRGISLNLADLLEFTTAKFVLIILILTSTLCQSQRLEN